MVGTYLMERVGWRNLHGEHSRIQHGGPYAFELNPPCRLITVPGHCFHWLYEVDEHSIHSPFFYDLYTKLVSKKDRPDFSIAGQAAHQPALIMTLYY